MRNRHHVLVGFVVIVAVVCSCAGYADQAGAFTIVQLCDTQLGMGGYDHDLTTFKLAVKQINGLKPDFVVLCGDLVNDAHDEKAWEDFLAVKAGLTMPSYCAPGNHDVGNTADPDLVKRYRARVGEDYFALEHKGYTFVCVNSQFWKAPVEQESPRQDAWFEKTLDAASAKGSPVIVFGHISLFVEKPDEPEEYFNLPVEKRNQLFALFKEHGVVAVLTGHSHRNAVHEYEGIHYVASASTSKNFDEAPMGFRIWRIGPPPSITHEYVAVEGASPPAQNGD